MFKYCDENKCAPVEKTKYENQNINTWLQNQKRKIGSVDDELYKKLSTNIFVKQTLDEYLNPDKKWNECKEVLFKYYDI